MKTVLVTGGASGIGEAVVQRLSATMRVVAADKDISRTNILVGELRAQGCDVHGIEVDVSRADSVSDCMNRIRTGIGSVDALFSNAGHFVTARVTEMSLDTWNAMMAVHVKGTFLCCQAVLPGMVERGAGAIVTMCSDYAVKGMAGGSAYAATKSALFSLTKSLALEFAPHGIRVNGVGPGPIETPLLKAGRTQKEWDAFKPTRAQQVPMGRLGVPDEVASVVEFLLSERSSFMTGQLIHMNGGQISW